MHDAVSNTRLLALRDARGWSQEELAQTAGVSSRTIQRIEAGATPSRETSRAIAAAFDLEPREIFGESSEHADGGTNAARGARWGIAGALVGYASAFAGVSHSLVTGQVSGASAGLSLGILGALTGIACAAIGWFSHRSIHPA